MTKIIFILTLFLSQHQAFGANLGFIFVRVTSAPMPTHTYQVQLFANGHELGPKFAHADSGTDLGWHPLESFHLNPHGSSTTIYASYGSMAGTTCEFDYDVYFSMDGGSNPIRLGSFHAPSSPNSGTIPLGLGCGKNQDRLCSSQPAIEQQIIIDGNRAAKARFDTWMKDYSKALQDRQDKSEQVASDSAQKLQSTPTPDFDREQREFLDSKIKEWSQETQEMQQEQKDREAKNSGSAPDQSPEDIAKLAETQARRQAIAVVGNTNIGGALMEYVALDNAMADMIEREKTFQSSIRGVPGSAEDVLASRRLVDSTKLMRREALRGETFLKSMRVVIKTGVDLSPSWLKDSVKMCEVLSGRDLCIGHALTPEERAEKACGLLLRSAPLWARTKADILLDANTEIGQYVVKDGEKRAVNGLCSIPVSLFK